MACITDRVYGCLIAGAIGDALGAPAEKLYYQDIRRRWGKIEQFTSYDIEYSAGNPGAATDDTTLRHYMCLAIIRKGGRITPDDAARVWIDELNPERFWAPDKIALMKLKGGVDPREAGRGNIPSACPTMAMVPVGIINAGDPAQAYEDGYAIAGINGDGVNQAAAATVAAGVAASLAPGATWASTVQAMTDHSSALMRRAIDLTTDLIDRSTDVDGFVERFYASMLDWWSRPHREWKTTHFALGTGIETVPVVMALLRLCDGDANRCLIEGASFGRDADAISSLAGSLAGAIQGASALRPDWIAGCESANTGLFQELEGDAGANFESIARRMVDALRSERARVLARAAALAAIIDG